MFDLFGNHVEQKRLLTYALQLWRVREDSDYWIARTLDLLAWSNRMLALYKEGIEQAREALGIFERLENMEGQVECLIDLAQLLLGDRQLNGAEEAIRRSVNLTEEVPEFLLCQSSRILGDILRAKGEREKAIHQYNKAIEIGTRFNWHHQLFWTHYSLGRLFCSEDKFGEAHAHIERAKQVAVNDEYYLGCAMEADAWTWYQQGRPEDAVSEALGAVEIYRKLGAAKDLEECTAFLQDVERLMNRRKTGSPLVKLILAVSFWKQL